jgi:hypothetical protein
MMKLAPTDHVPINALKFLSAFTMLPGLAVGMVAAGTFMTLRHSTPRIETTAAIDRSPISGELILP